MDFKFKFAYDHLWTNLKFNAGSSKVANGLNWRIRKDDSPLVYKNPRYKSVAVHAARQLLMSELEGELNKFIPKFKRNYEAFLREKVQQQQEANYQQLIKHQQNQADVTDKEWGKINIETNNGTKTIVAKDKYGTPVRESLIIYYDAEQMHEVSDVVYTYDEKGRITSANEDTYSTKTVCHIDLAPQISVSSSKNIVMTQVQGRDYTRKELVSGGDLQFSISGSIVSDEMGVYPVEAVKKFIQIMEYNGIVKVRSMMFNSFNVKQVIVKDYSLESPEYKNVQPYSFSCVAVEPDEDITVSQDTISVINKTLELSSMNKWYKLILENKLASMAAQSTANTAKSITVESAGMGLDELITNI